MFWHILLHSLANRVFFAQQNGVSKVVPEPVRQVAIMALLGIALLGLLIIVGILLGGHWVRRYGETVRRRGLPKDMILPRQNRMSSTIGDQPNPPQDDVALGDTMSTDETIM